MRGVRGTEEVTAEDKIEKKPYLGRLLQVATLFLLFCPLNVFAQGVVFPVPGVQPSPLIRLTGVLEPASEPQASILPALTVWIKGERRTFRVEKVESAIAAYKGQDHLKKVSLLGLRLIGRESLLALLQSKERQGQTLVIEGWLRAKAGVLRVRSVRIEAKLEDRET